MKSNIFTIALLLFSLFGFSQNYTISGVVKEAKANIPIPGASVVIKNSTKGTSSDFDGNFTLSEVPSGSTIVFSFVGFKNYEYVVSGNNTNLTISLQEDAQSLEEVVVIGYGTQKKRDVTGAVSIVSSKTLEQLKPIKVEQALQGTVSGVNVTTQSGAPGAGLSIRIRGIATNGENKPTVIIDGYVGDISLLNPNDIESITVLKDAQAAIYGTIGANGVILVTTKMGKKNSKTTVSYNTYTGFQETSKKMNLLNATEYGLLLNESYTNAGNPAPFPNVSGLGKGTDWQNEVFDTGVAVINHDLSVSGGSDKMTYTLSGSHLDQGGIIGGDKSNFLRNTARIGINADITDKWRIKTNAMYTYIRTRNFNENGLGSVLFNAINTPSIYGPYQPNGDFTQLPSGSTNIPGSNLGNEIINPLAQLSNTFNDYSLKKLNGTVGLEYDVIKDLTITGRVGFNTSNSQSRVFNKEISYGGSKVFNNPRSSVDQNKIEDNNYSFDLFATYKKTVGENHNITGTLGTTAFKEWGTGLYATGFDVPNNSWEFADISLTTGFKDAKTASSYSYDERRLSQFGRLQYDYKGKYLLSAMIRRDLSTKFGPNNRVAYFPSFTGGWVISDEGFYGESKTLNFVKLRASYGSLGNDQIPKYAYLSLLDGEATYILDGALTNGKAIGLLANPDVKWEQAKKFDVGLDLRFFSDKVELNADYFIDTRKDLLIPDIPVSAIGGVAAPGARSPVINAGTVRNTGFEFAINYKDQLSDNLSFNVNYNVTTLKNEVTEVNNGTGFIEGGLFGTATATSRMQVGLPMGYFFGYQADGIFQNQAEVDAHPSQLAVGANAAPGDIRYKDVNGDGKIDTNDRTKIGSPIPDVTMGMNINLVYKNFDFVAYAFASIGNDMVRGYERTLNDVNRSNYILGRWTGEGTSNSVPRVTTATTANNIFSSYFVEDASYLRIQNVQLGYTLPTDAIKKAGMSKLRFYAAVNNLYTFTKYRGYDPGASSGNPIGGGVDYGFYPIPRTYMLGLNVNF